MLRKTFVAVNQLMRFASHRNSGSIHAISELCCQLIRAIIISQIPPPSPRPFLSYLCWWWCCCYECCCVRVEASCSILSSICFSFSFQLVFVLPVSSETGITSFRVGRKGSNQSFRNRIESDNQVNDIYLIRVKTFDPPFETNVIDFGHHWLI